MSELKEWIKRAGGAVKVAKACGITSQAVSQWKMVPRRHVETFGNMLPTQPVNLDDMRAYVDGEMMG